MGDFVTNRTYLIPNCCANGIFQACVYVYVVYGLTLHVCIGYNSIDMYKSLVSLVIKFFYPRVWLKSPFVLDPWIREFGRHIDS